MKIGLVDIDGHGFPNLALMKISAFHKQNGGTAELTSPLFASSFDYIYASKVFTASHTPILPEGSTIGGSGYNLNIELVSSEHMMPDYSLYPNQQFSLGFTTRGCIRKCPFCIVPEKEGTIREHSDIYEFYDRRFSDVVLLDNNILALPEHFFTICGQIKKEGLRVDFNQGLDHRLLTTDTCKTLAKIQHIEYRFAYDSPGQEGSVRNAINMLRKNGINRAMWYVLVGFNTTLEEDLHRLNVLRGLKQRAFVQKYNHTKERPYVPLARWVNQFNTFYGYSFEEFLGLPENRKYIPLFDGVSSQLQILLEP